jgi:hypothetical protein
MVKLAQSLVAFNNRTLVLVLVELPPQAVSKADEASANASDQVLNVMKNSCQPIWAISLNPLLKQKLTPTQQKAATKGGAQQQKSPFSWEEWA